ncbi:hypothetical protein JDV02_006398 [Purpureocillium takamizusanense]|uniref:Uncharacterized protein n=1 Tax=Purpureocillium takamizusanense TaxID=2060973 RepID=A0A9Q8VC34_9HYPO|nr:uncharacterized protein JDV02_006398 [Purpureocillium takamizusanense]UNI20298.1 hypothetical protein JDV02_006398 [Purpureocillium takamizusanense]
MSLLTVILCPKSSSSFPFSVSHAPPPTYYLSSSRCTKKDPTEGVSHRPDHSLTQPSSSSSSSSSKRQQRQRHRQRKRQRQRNSQVRVPSSHQPTASPSYPPPPFSKNKGKGEGDTGGE